ncbi:MAG TPA: hypothetical protein VK994_08510 [Bacteroidales bacterium]|nr:hypothetical protein [Bacteroidales bacterium]
MKRRLLSLLLTLFFMMALSAWGQVNIKDSVINTPIVYGGYGFHFLGGDIAKMYTPSSTIGGGVGYKTKKNFYFGFEYSYLFGGRVKNGDEIIKELLTSDGQLIGQGGEFAIFQYYERGHIIWAQFGKLIPVLSRNPNSGLLFKLGGGFVQHRMDVSVQENTALQVSGDYKYGYDRLTRGFGLNQFIGYLFIGESRIWNFYAGLDFSQAWTRNVRDVNFDTRMPDNSQHLDLFFGFKVGWVIPIYRHAPPDYYFN